MVPVGSTSRRSPVIEITSRHRTTSHEAGAFAGGVVSAFLAICAARAGSAVAVAVVAHEDLAAGRTELREGGVEDGGGLGGGALIQRRHQIVTASRVQ